MNPICHEADALAWEGRVIRQSQVTPGVLENHLEEKRVESLLGLQVLDTADDLILDGLTEVAAMTCNTTMALIALVGRERVWFKSTYGVGIKQANRNGPIYSHAMAEQDPVMMISDALADPRFASDRYVTGDPFIRFFAAARLLSSDGYVIGGLCVLDGNPGELTEQQISVLKRLSLMAMDYLEVHRRLMNLTQLLYLEKDVYNGLLRETSQLLATAPSFDNALNSLIAQLDFKLGWLSARIRNMQTGGTTGVYYNLGLPRDSELASIWNTIDSTPGHPLAEMTHTEFISSGPNRPEYSYLVVPVRTRNRLVAVLEFLYPDHQRLDPRILEVFNFVASKLSVFAERELLNNELRYQATHDLLTGAANRMVILNELERDVKKSDVLHPDSLLIYIDIDGFKEVNDNFGHDTGDRLLVEITRRLRGICRQDHFLGRLSGDEFILLIRNIDVKEDLHPFLERLQSNLAQSFMLGELEISVTSSMGCVVISDPDISPSELLRRAEEAMYLIKNGQRNGFCIADEAVVRRFQARRHLDKKIREAFLADRFFLAFQPLVDLQTSIICGAEALLRLQEKDGTVLAAGNFMAAVERTKHLPKVDAWVFTESIHAFKCNVGDLQENRGFRVAINVSPAVLSTKGYASQRLAQLEVAGISPTSLTLEIVESNLIPTNRTLIDNLKTLRSQGVLIAVDDFGTGYSSLQHLSLFPIDIIKIDRMFLRGITARNATKNAVLAAIISIGGNLGCTVIAEGVEEQVQSDHLLSLGCRYAQGYLYGRPMSIGDFMNLVKSRNAADEILCRSIE
jgi:diguanylate cyclase (GGDEF)-like protein